MITSLSVLSSRKARAMRWLASIMLLSAAFTAFNANANSYPLPAQGSRLIGQNFFHEVKDDDGSLEAIAKK